MLKVPVTSEDHSQGGPLAAIVLVEYGDYECPYCAEAYPVVKQLQQHFGDDLRFIFRNFPLQKIHPLALIAAETAEFAASKGKFWEMHDHLFEHQQELSPQHLLQWVRHLGLDGSAWEASVNDQQFVERIEADLDGGVRSGVNGTPTFFINGIRHNGPSDFESLRDAILTAGELSESERR